MLKQTQTRLAVLIGLLTSSPLQAALLISEVDVDQEGTDTLEFIELVQTNHQAASLDGYELVLFNGRDESAYAVISLQGLTTDPGGVLVLGAESLAHAGASWESLGFGTSNQIQNGADAIGLFLDRQQPFMVGDSMDAEGLVDWLVYGTADADDPELLAWYVTPQAARQLDETAGNSISRLGQAARDGRMFAVGTPSPGESSLTPVPLPAAGWLFLAGMGGLAGIRGCAPRRS